jgi:hypothetical protein
MRQSHHTNLARTTRYPAGSFDLHGPKSLVSVLYIQAHCVDHSESSGDGGFYRQLVANICPHEFQR